MPRFNENNCATEAMIQKRVNDYNSLSNNDLDIIFEGLSIEKISLVLKALSNKHSSVNSVEFQFCPDISDNDLVLIKVASTLKAIIDDNNISIDDNNVSNDDVVVIKLYHAKLSTAAKDRIEKIFTQQGITYALLSEATSAKKASKKKSTATEEDFDNSDIENLSTFSIAKSLYPQSLGNTPKEPAAAKPKLSKSNKSPATEAKATNPAASESRSQTPMLSANKSVLLVSPVKEVKPPAQVTREALSVPRTGILKRKLLDVFNELPKESSEESTTQNQGEAVVPGVSFEGKKLEPVSSHEKVEKKNQILAALHDLDATNCAKYYVTKYRAESKRPSIEKVIRKEGVLGNPGRVQKHYRDLYQLCVENNFPLQCTPIDSRSIATHCDYVYPDTNYYFQGDKVYIPGFGLMFDPFRVNSPDRLTIEIANDLFFRLQRDLKSLMDVPRLKQLGKNNISIKRLICRNGRNIEHIVIVAPSGYTDGGDIDACNVIREKLWHLLAEIVAQMNEDITHYPNITFLFQTHYNSLAVLSEKTVESLSLGDYSSPNLNKSLQTMLLRAIDASLRAQRTGDRTAASKSDDNIEDKGCSEMKTLSLELKLRSFYDTVEIAGVENTSIATLLKMPEPAAHGRNYMHRLPCRNCMRTIPSYNVLLEMHGILSNNDKESYQVAAPKSKSAFFEPENKSPGFFAGTVSEGKGEESASGLIPAACISPLLP